ncbi:MAG: DUF4097 family beta strand repeat protein [Lachnospiraceae bacterium]|nr:DUF4097 family beta strand repeat protein [Lachnospiraceae bacterium]
MKNTTKISLLAIAAGLILIGVGFAITGGNWKAFAGKKSTINQTNYEYECTGNISAIDFEDTYEGVVFTTGDVSKATVSYYITEGHDKVNIKESNGTLCFEREELDKANFTMFVFDYVDTKTVITLPKDFEGPIKADATSGSITVKDLKNSELQISNKSGSIKIENVAMSKEITATNTSGSIHVNNLTSTGNITIESSSGSVRADGINCKDFSAKASSGSVHADNLECDNLTAHSNSGSVRVNNATVKSAIDTKTTSGSTHVEQASCSSLESKANSGSINLDDVKADTVKCENSSGGIHLDKLDVTKAATLKASSGSINGTMKGKETDFSIIASTTSGLCNLKGSREGEKTLDANTTSGSINIKFE